jgi:hypothetical protein
VAGCLPFLFGFQLFDPRKPFLHMLLHFFRRKIVLNAAAFENEHKIFHNVKFLKITRLSYRLNDERKEGSRTKPEKIVMKFKIKAAWPKAPDRNKR